MTDNSSLFNKIGLDIGYFILAILVLLIITIILLAIQITKTQRLKKRLDRFVLGGDGQSLEHDIGVLYEDNKLMKVNMDKNKKDIRTLFKNMEKAYQKKGLVKYDAFNQMGGKLSFSLALLDENDDGFILNSVHSTDGCYTYTKEVKGGESSILLGKEEMEALEIAIGRK